MSLTTDRWSKQISTLVSTESSPQMKKQNNPDPTTFIKGEDQPKLLVLPYIKGHSERIEWTTSLLNIRAVFQTQSTIRQRVMKVKGRPKNDEVKGVIYSIPCERGATYIGETGWNLHTQVKEHRWAVCKGHTNNGIAVHVMKMNHNIHWKKAQTIRTESHPTK